MRRQQHLHLPLVALAALLVVIMMCCNAGVVNARIQLTPQDEQVGSISSHSQKRAPQQQLRRYPAAGSDSGDGYESLRAGASQMLRTALNYFDDPSSSTPTHLLSKSRQRQARHEPTESLHQPLFVTQLLDVLSALYLPVDYAVHVSTAGEGSQHAFDHKMKVSEGGSSAAAAHGKNQPHPLHNTYEVALSMFGFNFMNVSVGSSKTASPALAQEESVPSASHEVASFAASSAKSASLKDAAPTTYILIENTIPLGNDPTSPFNSNTTFNIQCYNCAPASTPTIAFSIDSQDAQPGTDYNVIDSSPLYFPVVSHVKRNPPIPTLETVLRLSVSERSADPFASLNARLASLIPLNLTLKLSDAHFKDNTPILLLQPTNSSATYTTDLTTRVRLRSQSLPSVFFHEPTVAVTDLDSVAIFSVSCRNCGMVDLKVLVRTNTSDTSQPESTSYAFQDLWGIGEILSDQDWRNIDIMIPFTADVNSNPLPTSQPDLSAAGWQSRSSTNNISVVWLDSSSLTDPNHLQTVHFALHLDPIRWWQISRTLRFDFMVQKLADAEDNMWQPESQTNSISSASLTLASGDTVGAPIILRNNPDLGEYPSSTLRVNPTIYCSPHGKIANATLTVYTCNSTNNFINESSSQSDYVEYTQGSLLDVFAGETVQLDSTISNQTTCNDVWAWFNRNSSDTFVQQYFIPGTAGMNATDAQTFIFNTCSSILQGGFSSNVSHSFNSSLIQYCQLSLRCYTRAYVCHTWIDSQQFCVCPYDRTGDYCEQFTPYQCNIALVYPMMDVQTYEEDNGASFAHYSCEQPSSFRNRLPTTYGNAGSNSKVSILPSRPTLQEKYNYLPFLDGDQPCVEYPNSLANPSIQNPSPSNPYGTQQFRFTLQCSFTPDQDLSGASVTSLPPDVPFTYTHVRQGPSDSVLQGLTDGNYTFDDQFDQFQGGWQYQVLINNADGSILFAMTDLAENPLQLRFHPQNFAILSEHAHDSYSHFATADILQNPPTAATISNAITSGDPSILSTSTLGAAVNISSLSRYYWNGGRYYFEAALMQNYTRSNQTRSKQVVYFPRGLQLNSIPLAFFMEKSDYSLPPPAANHRLTILVIAILAFFGFVFIAIVYKYYMYKREQDFLEVVKKSKAKFKAREREREKAKQLRKLQKQQEQERLAILNPPDL